MPRFNPLTPADRDSAYAGDTGDTAALFEASAALDREVLGVDLAFAVAPNMAPLGYPFSARWEADTGTRYVPIGAAGVRGQPTTRTKETVAWELFLGVGPGAGDRAQLQGQTSHYKREIVRAYHGNTTLGLRTDTAQAAAGVTDLGPICHETQVDAIRWARMPWGRAENNAPLHHYGWLVSLHSELTFTARRA